MIDAPRIESLLRSIAPDFAGMPLYVALESAGVPPELLPGGDCLGGWHATLDVALRGWLGSRWCGRGPAIIVCDRRIRAEARELADGDERLADGIAACRIYAAALHEAAHAIDGGIDLEPVEAPCEIAATVSRYRMLAAVAADFQFSVPWLGHDASFIRALCHLVHRSRSLTPRLPTVFLFCHDRYGLSPLLAYRDALGPELESFSTLPVRKILTTSSPPAFAALWQADVQRWTKNQSNEKEKVA